jgi:DNA-binding LacI/PurR family transcriptional regulator
MADVAARAGVSLSTVSLTFSGGGPITPDTKKRVEKAAAELGYSGPSPVAKSLRSGRSHIVGLVLPEQLSQSFRDPFALKVLDGAITSLGDLGLGILLIPAPMDAETEHPLLETSPMDAAIVMRVRDHDDPSLKILRRRGIPSVIMEGPAPKGWGVVTIDDEKATTDLIRHLIKLGHTRIGTVTLSFDVPRETRIVDPSEISEVVWTPPRNRLKAFKRAGVEPCVIVECRTSLVEEGIAAGHLALSHPSKPTALVCQSDILAAGVVLAARELDLQVPQDLSVTGFDGLDLAWLAPHELTTVIQDATLRGEMMATEVHALLDGETPTPVDSPLEIRLGTTTAKAPA